METCFYSFLIHKIVLRTYIISLAHTYVANYPCHCMGRNMVNKNGVHHVHHSSTLLKRSLEDAQRRL